jgi:hypothetical protein
MMRAGFFLFFMMCTVAAFAQRKNENSLADVPFKERVFTGGGLGMSFGSYQDYIAISPLIGYRITEKFWGGSSFTFRYTKYKEPPTFKLYDYGFNPFLRYSIFENIFVQTEYEYLNYEYPYSADGSTIRKTFNSFLAGGGFMQPIGDKAAFYALALYNFSYQDPLPGEYSPYYSPWIIRAGISIGF